jgi:hypothetical protein
LDAFEACWASAQALSGFPDDRWHSAERENAMISSGSTGTILPDLVAQEAFGRERYRSEDGLNSTGRSSHMWVLSAVSERR